ncbi:putative bifunctional diguanylate cyclase/phosphodiesterase [Rhizobium oryzicola]|uniref:EAL domain-containing protein n=1 Tax=Rhizobium oryzicola TaxID=1232668 RepID=A0ABT8SRZ1_9HYPH|nr:EAL domain-containing protein [Rhizobium oryzicola]MDO1580492.1 EAL domain-containing protein [Rhizobium oryzicola]
MASFRGNLRLYGLMFVIIIAAVLSFLNNIELDKEAAEPAFDSLTSHYLFHALDLAVDSVGILCMLYAAFRLWNVRKERERRESAETRADWMALHDRLTGLHNRHSLEERLDALGKQSGLRSSFSILVIDLDGFKKINDMMGHHAGDSVLRTVADRIREEIAEEHVFRSGGDEFVLYVEPSADAPQIAKQLLQALNKPVLLNGTPLDIGASIGMATCPEDATAARDCLRCADAAMYAAKAAGRGSLRAFDKTMQERMLARDRAERNLRDAIRAGGIQPYYQPIVDLQKSRIIGFEALARWQMGGEFISPMDFIPLAEETGLIMELTESLLRRACEDAMNWPPEVILSFNISPIQLQDKLLGLRILKILSQTGFQPKRLEIEITETALIQDVNTAAVVLSDLRTAGISVALDDFGTGYSSLAQLSNFSFDKIKIDRSFVASFQDQEKQEKIVKAIVGLGIGLEVPTTAEGIETPDQLTSLIDMGCTYGQGYFFGKAVPATEALNMLAEPPLKALRA